MVVIRISVLTLLTLLLLPAVHAADGILENGQRRPVVGLVLSGGGARGAVHLGILKVLEELRVPVDIITGTSMGAVVGGLYALGYSTAELDEQLVKVDWNEVFIDKPPRDQLDFRRKEVNANYLFKLDAGVKHAGITIPSGPIYGQKISARLKALTLFAPRDFDALPIKYRAVAADIETGEEVVLSHGDLATAMRASLSIPGIFAPVDWDGRVLVDGGLANNVPVQLARELGAEVLIVVDLNSKPKAKEQLTSPFSILNQILGFHILQNSIAQLQQVGTSDVLIQPDTSGYSSTDFTLAAALVQLGVQEGRNAADQLRRFSLSEDAYRNYLARTRKQPQALPTVEAIHLRNDSHLKAAVLKSLLKTTTGKPLNIEDLNADLDTLYGLDIFQSVDYDLTRTAAGAQLDINARQKSWGPDYLGFGLVSVAEERGNIQLAADYTVTPFNADGGEWRSEAQVGYNKSLLSEFYQPLDDQLRYNLSTWAAYRETHFGRYVEGKKAAEYIVATSQAGIGAARLFGNCCKLHVDLVSGVRNTEPVVGDVNVGTGKYDIGAWTAGINYDRLDNVNFPRHGALANAGWTMEKKSLGSDLDQGKAQVSLLNATSWQRNTLLFWGSLGGVVKSEAAAPTGYAVGGFFNLSGYERDELSGRYAGVLRMMYVRELARIPFTLALPFYAGFTLEAGNVWDRRADISAHSALAAGALLLALDTPVGPLYIAKGFAEKERSKSYVFLGRSFDLYQSH